MTAPLESHARVAEAAPDDADAKLRREVKRALLAKPKTLPAKLFYDDAGARFFERICALDEYYLTRAELEILGARAGALARLMGPRCALIEYGSGAGKKVRLLLDRLEAPAAYVPIDISARQLIRTASRLGADYPAIAVRAVRADYTRRVTLPALGRGVRRVAFFPGSTIGNFHAPHATAFLRRIRRTVGAKGALILGVDRRKDPRTLEAAYNDAAGVTAAFNLNVLVRLNRDVGTDFDLRHFRHRAFFNSEAGRVEMHLESTCRQTAHVDGAEIRFSAGETIWTESSYKYDRSGLDSIAAAAGFSIIRRWTDSRRRFWVAFLTAA